MGNRLQWSLGYMFIDAKITDQWMYIVHEFKIFFFNLKNRHFGLHCMGHFNPFFKIQILEIGLTTLELVIYFFNEFWKESAKLIIYIFWIKLFYLLDTTNSFRLLPDLSAINRLGLCWWLLCHISPLYQIDMQGNVSSHHQVSKQVFFEFLVLWKCKNILRIFIFFNS